MTTTTCPIVTALAQVACTASCDQLSGTTSCDQLSDSVAAAQELADHIVEADFDSWLNGLNMDELARLLDATSWGWKDSTHFESGDTLATRRAAAKGFILGLDEA